MLKREVIEDCPCESCRRLTTVGNRPRVVEGDNGTITIYCLSELNVTMPTRAMAVAAWNAAMKSARTKAVKRGK